MLDNGIIDKNKVEDVNFGQMVHIMKDIGKIIKLMDLGDWYNQMDHIM